MYMYYNNNKQSLHQMIMAYSHKDINNKSNTNAYTIIGGFCRFRYEQVY